MRLYILHLISFWMELYSHTHTATYIHVLWSRPFIECNLTDHSTVKRLAWFKTITTSSRWKTCTASGERMVFHTKHFPWCTVLCVCMCGAVQGSRSGGTTTTLLPHRFLSERLLCHFLSLSLSLALAWKSRAAKTSGIGYYVQYIA